jgi:hypothetical protein
VPARSPSARTARTCRRESSCPSCR